MLYYLTSKVTRLPTAKNTKYSIVKLVFSSSQFIILNFSLSNTRKFNKRKKQKRIALFTNAENVECISIYFSYERNHMCVVTIIGCSKLLFQMLTRKRHSPGIRIVSGRNLNFILNALVSILSRCQLILPLNFQSIIKSVWR